MSEKNTHEQDLEWLREIATGARAENALTEKYFNPLGMFFKKNARRQDKADDLRQQLFYEITLATRAGKIKIEKTTFIAYLYGVARKKVARSWKVDDRNRQRNVPHDTDDPTPKAVLDKPDLEKSVQDKITLEELLAKLGPREREILFDYYVAGLSGEEIKQKYGYSSAAAARKDIERIRKRAKE
jgi:RNA polymerase sigma factor (sigma-70 family)